MFDFKRMEVFMETMTKSMETLTFRSSSLEKGQPSHAVERMGNPPRPVDVPHLMYVSTARPAPAWHHANKSPSFSRPTAASGPPMQSANPDFHEICKALYRMVQLRRQAHNWKTLPAAIKRDIQRVADSVNPVHPSEELVQDISNIFARTGSDLHKRVQNHFSERLTLNMSILENSNPADKERAVEVVIKQLRFKLGSRVTEPNLRQLVESEARMIGVFRDRAEVSEVTDRYAFRKPSNPAKKPCMMKPSPTNTHNAFSVLSTLEEAKNDLEQDSPSPTRKIRTLPTLPLSSPRTPAASTPNSTTPSNSRTGPHLKSATTSAILKLPPRTEAPSIIVLDSPPQHDNPAAAATQSIPTGPVPSPTSATVSHSPRPSRFHLHSGKNKASWKIHLRPDTKFLIVSDSNFKYLTDADMPPGFQLECFSGANFTNVMGAIQGLPSAKLHQLIIALGINHREYAFTSKTSSAMDLFLETCGDTTVEPVAAVGVSINPRFFQQYKDTLTLINRKLRESCLNSYIPPLADREIKTSYDTVHYMRDKQLQILQNIIHYTKKLSPNTRHKDSAKLTTNSTLQAHSSAASTHDNTNYTSPNTNTNHNRKQSNYTMNLSNHTLTKDETDLLDFGLSFIPTINKMHISQIQRFLDKVIRSIKLRDYFTDDNRAQDTLNNNINKFTEPSTWVPENKQLSLNAKQLITNLQETTEKILRKHHISNNAYMFKNKIHDNLNIAQRQSITQLRNNEDIIVKSADKGGMVCVLNKSSYLTEADRQLSNTKYYRMIDEPLKEQTIPRINRILEELFIKGYINEKQIKYLSAKSDDKDRKFYLLPKIHKPVNKWTLPDMPEGRPIVGDCATESRRISEYIDSFLKPLANKHPSYIKDTYDFVNKIRNRKIHNHYILVTGDITALYTNMNIDRTISAVKDFFTRYPDPKRPDEELLELLEIAMRNNDFSFCHKFFLQIFGTAMGKTFAPNLANIYF